MKHRFSFVRTLISHKCQSRSAPASEIGKQARNAGARILCVATVLVSYNFSQTPAQAETVKITTGEWEPLISKDYKQGGVILHIVREAFARKKLDVEFNFLPWARAVKYVEEGTWDAMAITGSRHSTTGVLHLYSDPVYIGSDVLFHRRDSPLHWQTFDDLIGKKFGAVLSYDYSDDYRAAVKQGKITQVIAARDQLLFPMLAAGRFDIFMMDQKVGVFTYNTLYRKKYGDAITYNPRPLSSLEYSVRFSGNGAKSRRLVNIFNQSLKQMTEAGTVDQYYRDFEEGFYLNP